ncbi:MAG: hypothetical protein HZC40_26070 [Chloroflexi bacterium]|nr:hypothetical protein [Chloroflexota bacterium]
MKPKISEKTVHQLVQKFYQERAERLHLLKLDAITAQIPVALWHPESESADKVVTRLIEKHLERFEDWWKKAMQDPGFCVDALRIRRQCKMRQQFAYDREFSKAQSRLTLQFINCYCTADYEIDWKKIVVFNKRDNKFASKPGSQLSAAH